MILDFHSLVAQVIPVFFLAATFESRWLTKAPRTYSSLQGDEHMVPGKDEKDRIGLQSNISQSYARIWLIILMFVGELAALYAVFSGSASSTGTSLAIIGLTAGMLVIVLPLVSLHASDIRRYVKLFPRQWWWHAFILALFAGATGWAISFLSQMVGR